ncbi:MAG: sec-independent protein translocase protein TatC [Saprospiraceae bacterium]|jgi:sec-independent protein translocase protein TatC|tara:strand:+ start:923 stop:1753 length:831 start_codon:yes stop_codon:yes gene_type:complete
MIKKLSAGDQPTPEGKGAEMSFFDHLDELRKVIFRSLVAIIIIASIVYMSSRFIFEEIIFGPLSNEFVTFRLFCEHLGMCFESTNMAVKTNQLTETFFVDLKVSFYIGLIASFPYIFYQLWGFIKPGLYSAEQKVTKGVVFVCSFLFFTGVAFGYFILSPFAIKFLGNYQVAAIVESEVTLSSYVGSMTMFIIPSGIMFQLPLVVFFLAKLGLITPTSMRQYRKHAFVTILVLAAILTPPDILTQFMIGVPIYGLYEISIFIAARETKKREKSLDN